MNYFIIGDIHGCYYTLRSLLEHWNRQDEKLICVGDYVDRGSHGPQVINLCMELERSYPERTVFLKGNHDLLLVQHFTEGHNEVWLTHGGQQTLEQYAQSTGSVQTALDWINTLPIVFEEEHIFVSHAGLSDVEDPMDEDNPEGVLWNRDDLTLLNKLQVHGHRALRATNPLYTAESNSWNIDTGACYGFGLTGIRVSDTGEMLEWQKMPSDPRDLDAQWQ